jgi:DNA-binding transcriptional MerR regulator
MRTLKTSEAATLLSVSPSTLRAWERRFGYPRPHRSAGQHRLYTHGEIAALGNALRQGLSIQSAISRVRESLSGDADTLIAALTTLDSAAADVAMESALALRSFDRCVEDVLLQSLDELAGQAGDASATWALAALWADGWLRRARRLAPPPHRRLTILLGDAGDGTVDGDLLATRALQLFCDREGIRVVTLPVSCVVGLGGVSTRLAPDAVVIAGTGQPPEHAVAWARHVEAAVGPLPRALFRSPDIDGTAAGAWVLPDAPRAAKRDLLARLEQLALLPAATPAQRSAAVS